MLESNLKESEMDRLGWFYAILGLSVDYLSPNIE